VNIASFVLFRDLKQSWYFMALFVLNRVRISDPQWHPYTKHGHVPPSLPLDRRVGGGRREGRVWEVRARE